MPFRPFNNNNPHHFSNRNYNRGGGGAHNHFRGRDEFGHMDDASARKRPFPFSARGGDNFDIAGYPKLFIANVPSGATEGEIRLVFQEYGNVVEVIFIKDKRTGHQQECCFIKYASSDEAERAIKALDKQRTLSMALGPIEVRYADRERERRRSFPSSFEAERKLYVAGLHKQATEKDIEEIFSPYGGVEDIYLLRDEMNQSRGMGFVELLTREMAVKAINALNGTSLTGCEMPLIVRFADPKKPKAGELRNHRGFAFDPRVHASLGSRPEANDIDPPCAYVHPNSSRRTSPQRAGPSSNAEESASHSVANTGSAPLLTTMSSCTDNLQEVASSAPALTPIATSIFSSTPSRTRAIGHPVLEWSEHTCPDGFTYYYNCITKESRWEKPEGFTIFKKQQQRPSL